MKIFRAYVSGEEFTSGFLPCLNWAKTKLSQYPLIVIERHNAGSKYTHRVAEVTSDGVRLIRNGSSRKVGYSG